MENSLINEDIKTFGELFTKGTEFIVKACKLYVDYLSKDPSIKEKFIEAYPDIPSTAWVRFELVGRGVMHHKLLTNFSISAKYLKKLPLSDQETLIDGSVKVLLSNGDTLNVETRNLTRSQAKQVFSYDHVRTLGEQKAYIESQKTSSEITNKKRINDGVYTIKGTRLIISGDIVFTKKHLIEIIEKMEANKND